MLYSILSSKTVDRNEYTRLIPSFKVTLRNVKGLRRSKVTGAPDGGTVGSRELRELRRLRVEAVPCPVSRAGEGTNRGLGYAMGTRIKMAATQLRGPFKGQTG